MFYSAGVRSMLGSLHNFFFVSFDPGGLVTVDKPPLALWVQARAPSCSAFTRSACCCPRRSSGVLAVAALYWVIAPRFGPAAGVAERAGAGGVPVVRRGLARQRRGSGADPADDPRLRRRPARDRNRRLRTLLGCAVLVGLAFNTKTLAAYLVVPGIALGYLVCAPGSLCRAGCCAAAGGGRRAARRVVLMVGDRRTDARLASGRTWAARPTTPSAT